MENMRIIAMSGGLGTQLYQYTFARVLEAMTKEQCMIDDSAFWGSKVQYDGYELEKLFGIKLNLLSKCFSPDVWEEMLKRKALGVSIPQQLIENDINLTVITNGESALQFNGNRVSLPAGCDPKKLLLMCVNSKGNFYYHGFGRCQEYVNYIRGMLLKELVFPSFESMPAFSADNLYYESRIMETDSVAVHIRRDCATKLVAPEKYAKAVQAMEGKYAGCTYFVFSDDINWCQEHAMELGLSSVKGEVVFVTGNTYTGCNYADMQLMSKCKKMILSNSAFAQWAYYLNTTEGLDALVADQMA